VTATAICVGDIVGRKNPNAIGSGVSPMAPDPVSVSSASSSGSSTQQGGTHDSHYRLIGNDEAEVQPSLPCWSLSEDAEPVTCSQRSPNGERVLTEVRTSPPNSRHASATCCIVSRDS
jgi:hypothetical protein